MWCTSTWYTQSHYVTVVGFGLEQSGSRLKLYLYLDVMGYEWYDNYARITEVIDPTPTREPHDY